MIGSNGEVLNHHRKLTPTNPERTARNIGDVSGPQAIARPIGRIGQQLCWENHMPSARFALYAQGIDIYIAPTDDSGEGWVYTGDPVVIVPGREQGKQQFPAVPAGWDPLRLSIPTAH